MSPLVRALSVRCTGVALVCHAMACHMQQGYVIIFHMPLMDSFRTLCQRACRVACQLDCGCPTC